MLGLSIVSRWGGWAAESLFAVLFPSDCRIGGTPLVTISRLPVCAECLASLHPSAGCVCSVRGERILSPYAESGIDGEPPQGRGRSGYWHAKWEVARREQGDAEVFPLAQAASG